jgi:NADPH-dependent 7-cyano-7-deazaguanine reductase QueF-like protein
MNTIEQIASVHLGKAGDGSVVKPYVTPDEIDPSLLVAVPRQLHRTQYNIDDAHLPFVGGDVCISSKCCYFFYFSYKWNI